MTHPAKPKTDRATKLLLACWVLIMLCSPSVAFQNTDDLKPEASWTAKSHTEIKSEFSRWFADTNINSNLADRIFLSIDKMEASPIHENRIDWVVDAIAVARPDINGFLTQLEMPYSGEQLPRLSEIINPSQEHPFVATQLRVFFGRWLTRNRLYDEALNQFSKIQPEQTVDAATLLFYRGLAEHQLLKKDECLATVSKLLENKDTLPKRYGVLASLMQADIKPLETDSLDEISRLMGDIRRRTEFFRSGKNVIGKEQQVIEKLDKLIKKLESQQQAQQQQQSPANQSGSGKPMEDSKIAGGKGTGEITSKQITDGGNWGDLPPQERAAALAEIAKDLPPHYRSVIEEYFRQLAKGKQNTP